jgi:hypothetical protein
VQQDNPLTLLSDLSNTVKRKNILYLIQDIITRWNSTHDMIERFLKLRIFINDVINTSADHRTKTNKYLLNIDEIEVAECMLIILKPFKIITNMLSHSKLTSSRILPCLVFLKQKLQPVSGENESLNAMKFFMSSCLFFYINNYK